MLIPALLSAEHQTSAFDCGEAGLDTWLRTEGLSDQVGLSYLVVDALHERAATFYERHGFTRAPTPQALRLVLRVSPALLQP